MKLDQTDLNDLKAAVILLENPGIAIKLMNLIGYPIEKGLAALPQKAVAKIGSITNKALLTAAKTAIFTMKKSASSASYNLTHKLLVSASGGVGGFFGLAGLAAELPISTTIMLRSIADIARAEGEDINDMRAKLACIEVFSLGGRSGDDDAGESAYFALRTALAAAMKESTTFLAKHGAKAAAEKSAPFIARFISKVAQRFSTSVSEKIVAQGVPVIGAAGGAAINLMFMDHFQDMAKGHFTVRRLERKYPPEVIRQTYDDIWLDMVSTNPKKTAYQK